MVARKISPLFCHILLYLAIAMIASQSTGFGPTSPILSVFLTGLYGAVWLYVPVAIFLHFTLFRSLTSSPKNSSGSESNEEII